MATWQNRVVFTPDPARGGISAPGLTGRLYIFGKQWGFPITGDGSLIVDLFDESKSGSVMQEQWRIDPDTLKRLLKRDFLGWGYTLFLPWGRYRPETNKVRLRLCYQPPKGAPLYTESVITLAGENGVMVATHSGTAAPGSAAPAPAAPANAAPASAVAGLGR
jgi:hypothetical protein